MYHLLFLSHLQLPATLVMHFTALDWISGMLGVTKNSINLVSLPSLWISCRLLLSLKQLANTCKALA